MQAHLIQFDDQPESIKNMWRKITSTNYEMKETETCIGCAFTQLQSTITRKNAKYINDSNPSNSFTKYAYIIKAGST